MPVQPSPQKQKAPEDPFTGVDFGGLDDLLGGDQPASQPSPAPPAPQPK